MTLLCWFLLVDSEFLTVTQLGIVSSSDVISHLKSTPEIEERILSENKSWDDQNRTKFKNDMKAKVLQYKTSAKVK